MIPSRSNRAGSMLVLLVAVMAGHGCDTSLPGGGQGGGPSATATYSAETPEEAYAQFVQALDEHDGGLLYACLSEKRRPWLLREVAYGSYFAGRSVDRVASASARHGLDVDEAREIENTAASNGATFGEIQDKMVAKIHDADAFVAEMYALLCEVKRVRVLSVGDLEPTEIKVDGDSARASFERDAETPWASLEFVREDGHWRIDSVFDMNPGMRIWP